MGRLHPNAKKKRNDRIVRLHMKGISTRKLAKRFGISNTRVQELCKRFTTIE